MIIINEEIKNTGRIMDEILEKYMNRNSIYREKILESMKYSLFTGGKRLRPIMAIKTFEIFNNNIKLILPYAAAIEMIHTYSLIHDDLPAMDDDDYRRGKPTNHKVFGEAMAILAGDALLNLAFEIMSKDVLENSMSLEDYKRKNRAINEIANYSGINGMIGGQVVDLFSSYENMDKDKLLFMYKAKTAALFQASIVVGGILGGAKEEEISILREFSLYLGLSYQIQDDLLDAEEDKLIHKFTYLAYFDKEKSKEDMITYTNKALDLLEALDNRDTAFLKELTKTLVNRNY